jgi:transcriptional regulator with XRE-family HTH domain
MKKDETMGARIRAAREEHGMSQLELAQALGFQSATAVSLIESDERGVAAETLQRLCKVLECGVEYFLGQEYKAPDIQVALRADKDLDKEDKKAILRFIELAKTKKKRNG